MLCELWHEYVFRLDVHFGNELRIESAVAALAVCRCRVEFVRTIDFHILEGYISGLVFLYEFLEKGKGRRSGREAETEYAVVCIDRLNDLVGQSFACNALVSVDMSRDSFVGVLDTVRKAVLKKAAILGQSEFIHLNASVLKIIQIYEIFYIFGQVNILIL